MSHHLLIVNTIGLTGAEILLAELARYPEILALPGQNFIQFGDNLYRPHDYRTMEPDQVFESLNRHQIMKTGRCWAGLTKSMSAAEIADYPRKAHRGLFVDRIGKSREFLDLSSVYAETLYEAWGKPSPSARYVGFFGHNFLLQRHLYPGFRNRCSVVSFENGIYVWLSMISQRMTWNCIEAAKFYIVNKLLVDRFTQEDGHRLSIDIKEYHADPDAVRAKLSTFLGLTKPATSAPQLPGFVRYDRKLVERVFRDADLLERIYSQHPVIKLADSVSKGTLRASDTTGIDSLLDRYLEYWNTTCHTNFDWVGPIEEEIVARLGSTEGAPRPLENLSLHFYHGMFDLRSDHYDLPVSRLSHALGSLEDDILVPALPYFVRVAIAYLENICAGHELFTHSYLPIRSSRLYQSLLQADHARQLDALGLRERFEKLEERISEVERKVKSVTRAKLVTLTDA